MKYVAWSFYFIFMVLSMIFAAAVPILWKHFAVSVFCTLLSAVYIFLFYNKKKKTTNEDPGNYMQIFKDIMMETIILDQRMLFIGSEELKQRIEKLQKGIEEFVTYRDKMQAEFGMKRYGEIYSSFSLGELYVNRAWSAVADSNMEEAHQSMSKARRIFAVIGS